MWGKRLPDGHKPLPLSPTLGDNMETESAAEEELVSHRKKKTMAP